MEKISLAEFMEKIGCKKYPENWEKYFEIAKKEYLKEDFKYTKAEYYDYLEERYGALEKYYDVIKQAAKEADENPELKLFLALLCEMLKDRDGKKEELAKFEAPVSSPDGKSELGYKLVCALAMFSTIDYTYNKLKERNIPEEMILKVLRMHKGGITAYEIRNNGEIGYRNFAWNQLFVDGLVFPIKRLNAEIYTTLYTQAIIFRNKDGRTEAMSDGAKFHRSGNPLGSKLYEDEEGSWIAEINETSEYWEGHLHLDDGTVSKEKTRLYKNEWEKLMEKGDFVVSLHISPGERMTPELVDETIAETRKFFKKYYPDYKYKGFTCGSWLCSPKLGELLGEHTNIAKFSKRFRPLCSPNAGNAVFSFVFLKPDMNFEIKDLPENTSLERALKKYYLDGNVLHAMEGYFI